MSEDKKTLEIKAQCYVRATKDFNNSKKSKYVYKEGTIGMVKSVDKDGDFLVNFPDAPKTSAWAFKSYNQIEAIETPEAGSRVYATKDFNHTKSGKTSSSVKEGMQGTVKSVDKDGDFLVKFDDLPKSVWSFRKRCEILLISALPFSEASPAVSSEAKVSPIEEATSDDDDASIKEEDDDDEEEDDKSEDEAAQGHAGTLDAADRVIDLRARGSYVNENGDFVRARISRGFGEHQGLNEAISDAQFGEARTGRGIQDVNSRHNTTPAYTFGSPFNSDTPSGRAKKWCNEDPNTDLRSGGSRQKALLIGISYMDTKPDIPRHLRLPGSVNDAKVLADILKETYNWRGEMRFLGDKDPADDPIGGLGGFRSLYTQKRKGPATRENIKKQIQWLVEGAQAGDVLFFSYSGWGMSTPDEFGYEEDGLNECLLPSDFPLNEQRQVRSNMAGKDGPVDMDQHKEMRIGDDELATWLCCPLPAGVKLTVVIDGSCCGSALEMPFARLPNGVTKSINSQNPGASIGYKHLYKEETNPLYQLADITVLSTGSDADSGKVRDMRAIRGTDCDPDTNGVLVFAMKTVLKGVANQREIQEMTYDEVVQRCNAEFDMLKLPYRVSLRCSQPKDTSRVAFDPTGRAGSFGSIQNNLNKEIGRRFVKAFPPKWVICNPNTSIGQIGVIAGTIAERTASATGDKVSDKTEEVVGEIGEAIGDAIGKGLEKFFSSLF